MRSGLSVNRTRLKKCGYDRKECVAADVYKIEDISAYLNVGG